MYLLHTVIHGQQRLQSLALQHVGELHVNGLHGAGVTHNPVFVWIRGVIITGRSERRRKEWQSVDLLEHDWEKSKVFRASPDTVCRLRSADVGGKHTDRFWQLGWCVCVNVWSVSVCVCMVRITNDSNRLCALSPVSSKMTHCNLTASWFLRLWLTDWHSVNVMVVQPLLRDKKSEKCL